MKKTIRRPAIIALAAMLMTTGIYAVPAKPGLLTMRQADGTELKVRLVGDERSHYYLSDDGYLLSESGGMFYYADADSRGAIVRSDIVARPQAERTPAARRYLEGVRMDRVLEALSERRAATVSRYDSRPSVRPSAASPARTPARGGAPQRAVGLFDTGFPSRGEQKGLVILVEYQDVKFNTDNPGDYFSRMLNEDGFSDNGGTGCAAEYFRTSSMNQFRPEFDVYGPITLSHGMSYYGGNDYAGNDQHPEQMVIEACQQLDAEVDFSEYDRDGDGFIDNVFVFYAGRGEASGGSANTVWPHSWNVTSATDTPYIFDGVRLDRYACSNEWEGGRPDGVGTFIHEFSHVMGLPDLYATSYTSAFTPGAWSVLDYGPYNNGGCTPPLYSVYERYSLGWLNPTVIDGPADIRLRDIGSNEACIIPTGDPNEFFLLENRQQTGWDTYIPGHGMLVWHVDFDEMVWAQNTVNNIPSHQYVDLEEADNSRSEVSRAGDAFPGTSRVTSFTDDTSPSMRTWSGQALNLPITDITENGGIIRFAVAGGRAVPDAVKALEATDVTGISFTANWEPSPVATSYKISVYTHDTLPGGRVVTSFVDGYNLRDADGVRSTAVTGLRPATEYHYVIYAMDGDVQGEASNEISVTTSEATFEWIAPKALPAAKVTDKSFEARWEMMADATGYSVDIFETAPGEPYCDSVDFTGGVKDLPAGWKTNSTLSYANTAYSGRAIPSLRFARSGYIESPAYKAAVRSLTFWHRGVQASEENRIIVSICDERGAWRDFASLAVANEAGGLVTRIDFVPDSVRAVRITYDMQGKGSLALDDIAVEWGGDETVTGGYTLELDYATDNVLVKGLNPSSVYYYQVTGRAAGKLSQPSQRVKVTTLKTVDTGIGAQTVMPGSMAVDGRRLTVCAGNEPRKLTVCTMSGHIIYNNEVRTAATVDLPAAGMYIVRFGGMCRKISVR